VGHICVTKGICPPGMVVNHREWRNPTPAGILSSSRHSRPWYHGAISAVSPLLRAKNNAPHICHCIERFIVYVYAMRLSIVEISTWIMYRQIHRVGDCDSPHTQLEQCRGVDALPPYKFGLPCEGYSRTVLLILVPR
jgi:hypothetical protein